MLDARRVEGEVGERWKSKFEGGERHRRGLRRGRRQGRRRGLRCHGCRGLRRGRSQGLRHRTVVVVGVVVFVVVVFDVAVRS